MDRLTAISLKPSRLALHAHSFVLLLAITAVWLCGLSVWLKCLLTMMLLCAGVWQHQKLKQLPCRAIGFEQEQWWLLIQNNKIMIELVNEQLVLSWLVVLSFRVNKPGEKDSGKKMTLALWPDMADADDLRRLRVFLRNL